MTTPTSILDLPVELLLLIFPYLDVPSFLHFTSTCKALHQPSLLHEPSYWSRAVRTTFRVPNQPVVEQDGARWQKLYQRMLTQTCAYTWGDNLKANLGHSRHDSPQHQILENGRRRITFRRRPHTTWPEVMQGIKSVGVISDLQCGGWSTTLLTAKGALYTVGVIEGRGHQSAMTDLTPLSYPLGFARPIDRYTSSTAVRQFSSGRTHILALSDSGRIWSWHDATLPALHVKFLHHDIIENGRDRGKSVVRKVVAGWNKSAAMIEGVGIVLWEVLQRDDDVTSISDAVLVLDSATVPDTSFVAGTSLDRCPVRQGPTTNSNVGEVCNFVVLEDAVIFNTHLGEVFVSQIQWPSSDQRLGKPYKLPLPHDAGSEVPFVTDVQGSFQSFAIFTKCGAVLTGKQHLLLDLVQDELGDRSLFTRVPALQRKEVIQLAFGDHHFHALHAPGYITSYGKEASHCGALGLGSCGGEGRLRGLRYHGRRDAQLVPHAYTEGRRVWFEKEKRAWIDFLVSGGVDPAECMERVRMAVGSVGVQCQGEVSEWIEQEGRDWESRLGVASQDEEGSGAYFALSVAAAGWHSGALVLVNEALADKMRTACEVPDHTEASEIEPNDGKAIQQTDGSQTPGLASWLVNSFRATATDYGRWFLGLPPYNIAGSADEVDAAERRREFTHGHNPIKYGASPRAGVHYVWAKDHFPRLVLSDGTEMPGMVPFEHWRYGRPEWDLRHTFLE